MSTARLAIVSAGLGAPSSTRLLADELARATRRAFQARGMRSERVTVEVREIAYDVVEAQLTGVVGPRLAKAIEQVAAADCLIAATPIHSASYGALFKAFLDVVGAPALTDLPVLMAAAGGSARHSLVLEHHLRPLFTFLKAAPVRTAVHAVPDEIGSSDLADRVERAGTELAVAATHASGRAAALGRGEDDPHQRVGLGALRPVASG